MFGVCVCMCVCVCVCVEGGEATSDYYVSSYVDEIKGTTQLDRATILFVFSRLRLLEYSCTYS